MGIFTSSFITDEPCPSCGELDWVSDAGHVGCPQEKRIGDLLSKSIDKHLDMYAATGFSDGGRIEIKAFILHCLRNSSEIMFRTREVAQYKAEAKRRESMKILRERGDMKVFWPTL